MHMHLNLFVHIFSSSHGSHLTISVCFCSSVRFHCSCSSFWWRILPFSQLSWHNLIFLNHFGGRRINRPIMRFWGKFPTGNPLSNKWFFNVVKGLFVSFSTFLLWFLNGLESFGKWVLIDVVLVVEMRIWVSRLTLWSVLFSWHLVLMVHCVVLIRIYRLLIETCGRMKSWSLLISFKIQNISLNFVTCRRNSCHGWIFDQFFRFWFFRKFCQRTAITWLLRTLIQLIHQLYCGWRVTSLLIRRRVTLLPRLSSFSAIEEI